MASLPRASPAEAKLFGLLPANSNEIDGFVGIGTAFTPGAQRISAFIHEITHAFGRVPESIGTAYASVIDLYRFFSAGTRDFVGTNPDYVATYFSLDSGVSSIAQWGQRSDSADFLNNGPAANDPLNEIVGNLGTITNLDILNTEALGLRQRLI